MAVVLTTAASMQTTPSLCMGKKRNSSSCSIYTQHPFDHSSVMVLNSVPIGTYLKIEKKTQNICIKLNGKYPTAINVNFLRTDF
jgi:hypothetical protein